MPADDLTKGALEGWNVQRTGQSNRLRQIVKRDFRLKLMQEPESLLREGERRIGLRIVSRNRSGNGGTRFRRAGDDGRGEPGNGRRRKQIRNGKFQVEQIAQAPHHLHGVKRVRAEVEKIIVYSNLIDVQDIAPDCGDLFLKFSARRNKRLI